MRKQIQRTEQKAKTTTLTSTFSQELRHERNSHSRQKSLCVISVTHFFTRIQHNIKHRGTTITNSHI